MEDKEESLLLSSPPPPHPLLPSLCPSLFSSSAVLASLPPFLFGGGACAWNGRRQRRLRPKASPAVGPDWMGLARLRLHFHFQSRRLSGLAASASRWTLPRCADDRRNAAPLSRPDASHSQPLLIRLDPDLSPFLSSSAISVSASFQPAPPQHHNHRGGARWQQSQQSGLSHTSSPLPSPHTLLPGAAVVMSVDEGSGERSAQPDGETHSKAPTRSSQSCCTSRAPLAGD